VRIVEKCPKCGHWTLALNIRREALLCHRIDCNYEEPVDVEKYLDKNNVLPKLAESLKLNGKLRAEVAH